MRLSPPIADPRRHSPSAGSQPAAPTLAAHQLVRPRTINLDPLCPPLVPPYTHTHASRKPIVSTASVQLPQALRRGQRCYEADEGPPQSSALSFVPS